MKRDDLFTALRRSRELNGATPGALESFLAVRGARTMALRLERARLTDYGIARVQDADTLTSSPISSLSKTRNAAGC